MRNEPDLNLLDAVLDSWDRNNTILLNLLRALPGGALQTRAMESERDPGRIVQMLNQSATAVREAIKSTVEARRNMRIQIKLALKLAGCPMRDQDAGPLTWGVWMRKK